MIAACKDPCKTSSSRPRARRRSVSASRESCLLLFSLSLFCLPCLPETAAAKHPASSRELPYHNGPTLVCADCHEFTRGAPGSRPPRDQADQLTPAEASDTGARSPGHLKAGDVNELCLSCHAGLRGVPDVMGSDINRLHERSAGRFEMEGGENRHGHDLGPSLTCVLCHDPHGNGNPRNLRLASDPEVQVTLGLFVRPGSEGLDRYERRNVAYGTLDSPALREVSAICLGCHASVVGPAGQQRGAHGGFLRHPSYDSQADQANRISDGGLRGSTASAYWDLGIGTDFELVPRVPFVAAGAEDFVAASQVDAGRNGVFCLSCHSAHGTQNPFGLRWTQTGSEGVAGCNQCHAKGRRQTPDQLTQVDPARN